MTRLLFLDPHYRDLYRRWEMEATRVVASLRLVAGRYTDDMDIVELVGELCMKSAEFSSLWSEHPIVTCISGAKQPPAISVGSVP